MSLSSVSPDMPPEAVHCARALRKALTTASRSLATIPDLKLAWRHCSLPAGLRDEGPKGIMLKGLLRGGYADTDDRGGGGGGGGGEWDDDARLLAVSARAVNMAPIRPERNSGSRASISTVS